MFYLIVASLRGLPLSSIDLTSNPGNPLPKVTEIRLESTENEIIPGID
jgi:hypothetical protein